MAAQSEQDDRPQVERDVDMLAEAFARLLATVDRRLEGIKADFEVALLEQVVKLTRRQERLEALLAEKLGADMAESLLAAIASEP